MGDFERGPRREGGQGRFGGQRREGGQGRFGGQRKSFGPRQMYKATCAECGQECEVPFKPQEGREVFCRECYRKKRSFD